MAEPAATADWGRAGAVTALGRNLDVIRAIGNSAGGRFGRAGWIVGQLSGGLEPGKFFVGLCEFDIGGVGSNRVSDFDIGAGWLCIGAVQVSRSASRSHDCAGDAGDSISDFGGADLFGTEVGASDQYLWSVDLANSGEWIWDFSATAVFPDDSGGVGGSRSVGWGNSLADSLAGDIAAGASSFGNAVFVYVYWGVE